LQGLPYSQEKLVEVRHLGGVVAPATPHDAVAVDQKRGSFRDVPQPAELEGDVEAVRRVAVPVGEQRKVEIESLRPRDMRPRRVP
jgi:hypothetical protein